MPAFESIGKLMLVMGGLIFAGGLVFLLLGRVGLGRLPGDIFIQREGFTFFFPLVTMLIVSAVLTLVINLVVRFFR